MSALTGAFEGLGRGISKEADRKLNQWDDERVLKEQEKLIIAREKRIDAAARLRQTNQNTYTAGVNKITRTQKLIDDATAQADRIKLQEVKNEGLIGAQKAKNNAAGGGEGPLGKLTLIPTKVYDPITGRTTTTNQIYSPVLGRIVGQDEINSGVYLSEEQRHAAATKLSKDKDKDKDKDKHTTNPLLDEVDKSLTEDTPSDTSSDTSNTGLINTGKKLTAAQFQELTPAEQHALLTGGYNKSIENQNKEFTAKIKQLMPTQEGVKSGRNRTKRKTPPNTPITTKQISELPKAKIPLGKPVPAVEGRPQVDYNYGKRHNSETLKGNGWFGPLLRKNRKEGASTEISAGFEIEGKEVEIPLLVPTLTPEEVTWLLSTPMNDLMGKLPKSISLKAVEHAKKRLSEGKSPFYDN